MYLKTRSSFLIIFCSISILNEARWSPSNYNAPAVLRFEVMSPVIVETEARSRICRPKLTLNPFNSFGYFNSSNVTVRERGTALTVDSLEDQDVRVLSFGGNNQTSSRSSTGHLEISG